MILNLLKGSVIESFLLESIPMSWKAVYKDGSILVLEKWSPYWARATCVHRLYCTLTTAGQSVRIPVVRNGFVAG